MFIEGNWICHVCNAENTEDHQLFCVNCHQARQRVDSDSLIYVQIMQGYSSEESDHIWIYYRNKDDLYYVPRDKLIELTNGYYLIHRDYLL